MGRGEGIFERGRGGRAGGSKSFGRFHTMFVEVLWSLWSSERLMSSTCPYGCLQGHRAVVLMLVEGRYAPRRTDPRINFENTGLHNSESAQYDGRSNAESTNLQNYGKEGRLCCLRSPASTPRGYVSPSSQAGAGTYHWCESTR